MKTINGELAIKLAPYLKDFEVEEYITRMGESRRYKTLNLEEAIEFLVSLDTSTLVIEINSFGCGIYYKAHKQGVSASVTLEAIEKMLEYLLDNNLLGKQ